MTLRLACASTFTALGLACSSTVSARAVIYMSVPVIYAPPRPLDYPAPAIPVHVNAPPVQPLAMHTTVVVPPPTNYAPASTAVVTYAQPVLAMPHSRG